MAQDDEDNSSSRSSVSVDSSTKERLGTVRRQLAAHEDRDMTGDDTINYLIDSFENANEWVNMGQSRREQDKKESDGG